jgi:hypothetical protein
MAAYERLVVDFNDSAQLLQWGRLAVGLATLLKNLAREQECEELLASTSLRMRDVGQRGYAEWQKLTREMLATADAPPP